MTTRALDIFTIMHALDQLDQKLTLTGWVHKNPQQEKLFELLEKYRDQLATVTGVESLASNLYQELNDFLKAHKFDPMVQPFDPTQGFGVVSILDKLVQWLHGAGTKVQIRTQQGDRPGFALPKEGVNVYNVGGASDVSDTHLLEVLTKSGDTLWLYVLPKKSTEVFGNLDLVELPMAVMAAHRSIPMRESFFDSKKKVEVYAGAHIPMIDFDVKPDLDWLLNAETTTAGGDYYYITQAVQQFKFRMDETGARVKVATVIAVMRGVSDDPRPYILDRPFYGWFTQAGIDLPMAAFYADLDSFKQPEGGLEDL